MTTDKPRILIGSPVRQRPAILSRFLTSLSHLDCRPFYYDFCFINENDDPESSEMLYSFAAKHPDVTIHDVAVTETYTCNETTHYWKEDLIWKVAGHKDDLIRLALQGNYDGLFLIDSDLLLHPNTLIQLYTADVDIVSEIFWTKWQPEADPQPQVWLMDEYKMWENQRGEVLDQIQINQRTAAFLAQLKQPGLYPVGGLGACTLIRKHALQRGVNFKPIPNLSFWGEDRHFCVRAAALGLSLYVDTHYPAYHIYRESEIAGADQFLAQITNPGMNVSPYKNKEDDGNRISDKINTPIASVKRRRLPLTLSMIVKNEADRYLKQVLENHRAYIGQAVIIDDGSSDHTVEMIMETLRGIPVRLVRNQDSLFSNEINLRKQQWFETIRTNPEWILNLDADELFEQRFAEEIESMLQQQDLDVFCFRLYDFWNETHYREDTFWRSHQVYRPFLLRYRSDFNYVWKDTPQHCGRFPENILELPHHLSPLRLKHLGWAKPEDRLKKWHRYKQLDPEARYGLSGQYDSILDEHPHLVEWVE